MPAQGQGHLKRIPATPFKLHAAPATLLLPSSPGDTMEMIEMRTDSKTTTRPAARRTSALIAVAAPLLLLAACAAEPPPPAPAPAAPPPAAVPPARG